MEVDYFGTTEEVAVETPEEIKPFLYQLRLITQGLDLSSTRQRLQEIYKADIHKLGEASLIDFNDRDRATCYICRYALSHILGIFKALEIIAKNHGQYREWLLRKTKTKLGVCSVGGGPGTDALALHAHFEWLSKQPENRIYTLPTIGKVSILDRLPEWKSYYDSLLMPSFQEFPPGKYIKFEFDGDADIPFDDDCLQELKNADIVTLVKFVSAVFKKDAQNSQLHRVKSMLQVICQNMKPDSLLLYVDTALSNFGKATLQALQKGGLTNLFYKLYDFQLPGDLRFANVGLAKSSKIDVQLWWKQGEN